MSTLRRPAGRAETGEHVELDCAAVSLEIVSEKLHVDLSGAPQTMLATLYALSLIHI